MGPIENLTSLPDELFLGNVTVRPPHTTFEFDFTGCGPHKDFYEKSLSTVRKAIPYAYRKVSEMTGDWTPRHFKYNISVGRTGDTPAYIEPGSRPDEYNVTFHQENEKRFGKYAHDACSSIMNHEVGIHGPEFSSGERLPEETIERINIQSLYQAGLDRAAKITEKTSRYIV